MQTTLRSLNGAAVGFLAVVAAVGYVLSLRDPAGDVFAFTLIASLLCGALVGIPSGVVLARRLPAWPPIGASWRVLALCWLAGGVSLLVATYLWEPRFVVFALVPLLVSPLEFAALASRCRPRLRVLLTASWLALVVGIVVQGFAARERRRVPTVHPPPHVVPRPTPRPKPTPTPDQQRSVLERCALPTRADSDTRSPVVRALRHFIESPDERAVPVIIALDKRSLQRGNVLGRYPLQALAASPSPAARAYLAQQLASPTRHQEATRALAFIRSPPARR